MSQTFDNIEFRNVCGQFLTGVTIVTAKGEHDELVGFTANSFASVSLDPPLVLVCPDKKLGSYPAFMKAEGFAIHILGHEQEELSTQFAKRGVDKFNGIDHKEGLYGAPIIPGTLAVLQCRAVNKVDGGDHTILIGQVESIGMCEKGRNPLGFFRGQYTRVEDRVVKA